ncbi:beta-lactamase-like protein [Aspergillus bertholletiae]|uniref:Beta-lactamase-like protein n=1 Tax=Aspergillus bertholletiae TaxID=1226010 RepID=A0A5N7BL03_9EURO|nr:beta-lactamase-like protein [Aspergillus bertholletiae]
MGLEFKVFYSKRPGVNRSTPPGQDDLKWVPTTSTLIYGKRDAVLVDTQLTVEAAEALVDWVAASGKVLTTIYVTHGHGDHFFGNSIVVKRFPHAKIIARPEVISRMMAESAPSRVEGFWNQLFPGQIPTNLNPADATPDDHIELEGERLLVIPVGHTDCDNSTVLWVPSIGLVVAGDAVYNNTHPYLGETETEAARLAWIAALDKIAALGPKAVVGGHGDPKAGFAPSAVVETRQYLVDFERVIRQSTTADEVYHEMLQLYPQRLNPGSLWTGAMQAKPRLNMD